MSLPPSNLCTYDLCAVLVQLRMTAIPMPAIGLFGVRITPENVAKVLSAIVALALSATAVGPGQQEPSEGSTGF